MTILKILAIVMAELKKAYGEQFDNLPDDAKKAAILQYISEIMAKHRYLKYRIGEVFYNELNEVI